MALQVTAGSQAWRQASMQGFSGLIARAATIIAKW
jgi:hypothetical protein